MIKYLPLVIMLLIGRANLCYAQAMPEASRIEGQLNLDSLSLPQVVNKTSDVKTQQAVPLGADAAHVFLKDVIFTGVTVYSEADLNRMVGDIRQSKVSIADLYRLCDKITNRYRSDGYVVAQAFLPPQSIKDGVVKITIVEPYIDEVIQDGDVPSYQMVNMVLQPWRNKKLLNVNDLEATLLLINDLPGIHVQSVLEPQTKEANTGALVLRLVFSKEDKVGGRFSLDNYGSKFIGPYQFGASTSLNNSFGYMAETNIQTFFASQLNELAYINLAQNIPIYRPGLTLNLGANYSRVLPGYTLDQNNIKSQSRLFSVGATQSILRTRGMNLELSATLESRSSSTKVLGSLLNADKLTIANIGGRFEAADKWNGTSSINLNIRQGLNVMGARKTGSNNLSRLEGKSDFTSIQLQASRTQGLTDAFSLFGNIRGQYAFSPLLSSEEFGYGGNAIGRAYNASEIVGDKGIAAIFEVRYKIYASPKLILTPYVFYDIGKTWNLDKIDGKDFSGASAGLGMRGSFYKGLSFEAFIANPLTRQIETPQYGSGNEPVFKFSLEYQF